MGRRRDSPDFQRSNRILTVSYRPGAEECALAQRLIETLRAPEREALGQRLANAVCERLRVAPPRVRVSDAAQPHGRRDGRLTFREYGAYHFDDHVITIANLTAVRGKVVAGKTFFDTLIHELMHHLDRKLLRIPSTPHSPGFYSRIEDLKRKLAGPARPAASDAAGGEKAPWAPPPKELLASFGRSLEAPPPPEKRRPRWTHPLEEDLFGGEAPKPLRDPPAPRPGESGKKRPAPKAPRARSAGAEQLSLAFDEPPFTLDET